MQIRLMYASSLIGCGVEPQPIQLGQKGTPKGPRLGWVIIRMSNLKELKVIIYNNNTR